MAKMKGVVVVNTERCKGCNLCVVACPLHVLSLTAKVNQKGYNYVQQVVEENVKNNFKAKQSELWQKK